MKDFFTGRAPLRPRFFWLACLIICLIGIALRLHTVGRSLWLDETYSAWFSSVPLHELWHAVPLYETHPPMYYTLLKGWTALFGASETGMRSLSVLASMATVMLLACAGRILRAGPTGDRVALLAALLLALNRGHIEYAQQARPYALETLTATLAILFSVLLVRALGAQAGRQFTWRPLLPGMLGLGVAAGLTLWMHNTGILICFGLWVALLVSILLFVPGKRALQALAVGVPGVIALLIWSPFIPMFITQNTTVTGMSFWIVTNWMDPLFALALASGGKFPLILVALLAPLGWLQLWRVDRANALNLAIALLLPLAFVVVYSYLRTPVFIDRLFAWMAPSVMALTALGVITGLRQPAWRGVAAALVLALCAGSSYFYYKVPYKDWPAMVDYIARRAQPGDLVIASASEAAVPLQYYLRRQASFPEVLYMPAAFPALGMKHRTYISNLGAPAIVAADADVVRAALQQHRRVWLIQVRPDLYDKQAVIRNAILSSRKLTDSPVKGSTSMELFE